MTVSNVSVIVQGTERKLRAAGLDPTNLSGADSKVASLATDFM